MTVIAVEALAKNFWAKKQVKKTWGDLRSLWQTEKIAVPAVADIFFSIKAGERVAFIGPNGAGKSTTIKMLTGILYPSSGHATVLGHTPWLERQALSYKIGSVFGQRSQLWYHLPAKDTFDLLSKVYDQPPQLFKQRKDELVEVFELAPFWERPVRQLSLGQRMKCELVASLLHRPQILFLDEPTIGLDANAKAVVRDLIVQRSREEGTTLLLTSHDTADMELVCERVVVINFGRILFDCPISELRKKFIQKKRITLITSERDADLHQIGVKTLEKSPHKLVLEVDLQILPVGQLIGQALLQYKLQDITVEDPPMEQIIQAIYQQGSQ